ncbi:MAG: radical SAM protein [Candidatus Methanomethyliaceae archaeon]|nr:radical SAM protein [Candidatus Methanomethyliaceae archaeon]
MIRSRPCKTALSKSTLPGLAYSFNPYWGCMHGCLYCYVPDVMRNVMPDLKWGQEVFVKEKVLEILRLEVKKKIPRVVGVSTATDPYQPIERELEITRKALIILSGAGFPVSIQTKSPLVTRDVDLMMNKKFDVGFTITSTEREFQRKFEPGAPPPEERISALEAISSLGIKTWIFYGPIIPGYNDSYEEMERIVQLGAKTKSKIIYDRLNIKPMVLKRLKIVIKEEELSNRDRDIYSLREQFARLEALCRQHGVRCEFAFP